MRKLPGILLLFCLAAPLIGTYAGLRLEKYRIRKEVKKRLLAGLPDSELVFFKFSRHDSNSLLRWEHAEEFEYRGEMYDVVRQSAGNDTLQFWCWHDHAETKLNRELRQLIAKFQANDTGRHENERRLFCFFLTLFHEETPGFRVFCPRAEVLALPAAAECPSSADTGKPPFPPPDRV